jgi:prolyl-tRNA editing enzyme YbaK/EbsC (Cys-tRNA(Pro) deacylase)
MVPEYMTRRSCINPSSRSKESGWVPQANGGVPPFGHKTHLRVFIDPDLLQWPEVWAAAGTWHDVFGIEPHKLVEASEGLVVDLKRG